MQQNKIQKRDDLEEKYMKKILFAASEMVLLLRQEIEHGGSLPKVL